MLSLVSWGAGLRGSSALDDMMYRRYRTAPRARARALAIRGAHRKPSSSLLDDPGRIGDTGAMSTRLDAAPDDEQVRLEVELASDDPLGQLRGLRAATRQLDAWQREAIARARERGASWSDIGDALGVTKQAAWSSYNQDVRDALSKARGRSGLGDEDVQRLADEVRTERNRGTSAR
jgi:hypothetical protein